MRGRIDPGTTVLQFGHQQLNATLGRIRQITTFTVYLAVALTASQISTDPASAQSNARQIPANAHAESFGSGWECNRGFTEVDGTCAPIQVPANAFLTTLKFGRGWDCMRGFRENRGACDALEIPANAYLNASGNGWKCLRGFLHTRDACTVITVPANAFLDDTSYRTGWRCDRGFAPHQQRCEAVQLPDNSHLDYRGNDWECDTPFRRRDNMCVLP